MRPWCVGMVAATVVGGGLLAAPLPASAVSLATIPVALCAPLPLFATVQNPPSLLLQSNSQSLRMPLATGPAQQGAPRDPDGCWRFDALLPEESTRVYFEPASVWAGDRKPTYEGVCENPVQFAVDTTVQAGSPLTITLPADHVVPVTVRTPSGRRVLGAEVAPATIESELSIESAGSSSEVPWIRDNSMGYSYVGIPYTGQGAGGKCLSETTLLLLGDVGRPMPATGSVEYYLLGANGSVTTQTAAVSDDVSDGLDAVLPFEVPDVSVAAGPTTPPSTLSRRTALDAGGLHEVHRAVAYGTPTALTTSVVRPTGASGTPVPGAAVKVESVDARGRRTTVAAGRTGQDGAALLHYAPTVSGRYLVGGAGYTSGGTWVTFDVRPQPPAPVAVPSARSVTLRWARPADGGKPLTSYALQWAPAGGPWSAPVVLPASARAWTTPVLAPGKSYRFRLSASNAFGASAASAPVQAAAGVPAPVVLEAAPRSSAAVLSWGPPVSPGGYPLRGFRLQARPAGGAWRALATAGPGARSVTAAGLVNGRAYEFRAAPFTSRATGPWSTARVVAGAPSTPSAVAGAHTTTTAGLRWGLPRSTNGSPVRGYVVQYRTGTAATWVSVARPASARAWTLPVVAGAAVELRVGASNGRGLGPMSRTVVVRAG